MMLQVLPAVGESVWMLSYYNNVIASVIFLPIIILNGELSAIQLIIRNETFSYWNLMVITGICGFAIGYVTGLQIKVSFHLRK